MISSLLALALLLPQGPGSEPPILRVGETLAGALLAEDDDGLMGTHLGSWSSSSPASGRSMSARCTEPAEPSS